MVFINILQQNKPIKEIGRKIIKMVWVFSNTPMDKSIKVIGSMIKDKVKENLHLMMAQFMKDHSKMTLFMVKE
jgi:hypothetical protein